MLSNYKYFGSRKFPEIDKIVINADKIDKGWMTLPHKSLHNYSISDEASIMPSISIKDGKGSISERESNSMSFPSRNLTRGSQPPPYKLNHPKTKQAPRGKSNTHNNLLFSTLRQTLKTESQPLRESVNRDIHTAFMNS